MEYILVGLVVTMMSLLSETRKDVLKVMKMKGFEVVILALMAVFALWPLYCLWLLKENWCTKDKEYEDGE